MSPSDFVPYFTLFNAKNPHKSRTDLSYNVIFPYFCNTDFLSLSSMCPNRYFRRIKHTKSEPRRIRSYHCHTQPHHRKYQLMLLSGCCLSSPSITVRYMGEQVLKHLGSELSGADTDGKRAVLILHAAVDVCVHDERAGHYDNVLSDDIG